MDLTGKIVAALAAAAIVWLLGTYIWQRRLCAVAKYFPCSELSPTGITLLLTLLNRGHKPEAEIAVELDPRRKYHLLSRSADGIRLDGSTLRLDRLAHQHDAGAIILVENGDFTNSSIVSSIEASIMDDEGDFHLLKGIVPLETKRQQ